MHWGVFAISAAHLYLPKLPLNYPLVRRIRVVSPRKVSRFAPLNHYYIIIDEVFFDNFLEIIYLLVVCKKIIIHSFWSTLNIYLLVVHTKKK